LIAASRKLNSVNCMPPDSHFYYDVFLKFNAKDKHVARRIASKLRRDGLTVWVDHEDAQVENSRFVREADAIERTRILVLCISDNVDEIDWRKFKKAADKFRDPLNLGRRAIILRLQDTPVDNALAELIAMDWDNGSDQDAYDRLLEATRQTAKRPADKPTVAIQFGFKLTQLRQVRPVLAYAFSDNAERIIAVRSGKQLELFKLETGDCYQTLDGHTKRVTCVAWSADLRRAVSGAQDNTLRLWNVPKRLCYRVLEGHKSAVTSVAWSVDHRLIVSSSEDNTVRLWDAGAGACLRVLKGHTDGVRTACFGNHNKILSGSKDHTVRVWDLTTGDCVRILEGHTGDVSTIAVDANQRYLLSGSEDNTVRLWDLETGLCVHVLTGHKSYVRTIAWSAHGDRAVSGGLDNSLRLWDIRSGYCLSVMQGFGTALVTAKWSIDQSNVFAGDDRGGIWAWDMSRLTQSKVLGTSTPLQPTIVDQVEYTNAKVLLVGDTSSGKTALVHRLATRGWKPSDSSTIGVWCTQWPLSDGSVESKLEHEIWLWDFGGQADQRLVHQLYMDRAALILLLFDADKDDVLPGLRDWQVALRRSVKDTIPQFLVAGRTDAGFRASRGKLQAFAHECGLPYHETSAKSGEGCDQLRTAITTGIPWSEMEIRTSPRIFKMIKDEILKLRDQGRVLHTFKELRDLLSQRLPRFSDETLQTVIGLLDGPGVVKELDYGTYVLLAPEWINAYAQAVIRTLRNAENDLGVLPLRSIAEGKLIYQSVGRDGALVEMKRLPPAEERVVLGEMELQLERRGLCLRQGDKLVFPSHCGRDRPAILEHPLVFVSYAMKGYLDDIYATLVVKLADSESSKLKELWRDAADFVTLVGDHHMGVKLRRDSGSQGSISVYFGAGVTQAEQVIFANYIHAHLLERCETVERLRYYVCPHCHTPKGNPEVLMKKLLAKKRGATVECDKCEKRFHLWDDLEKLFASKEVRGVIEELQAGDVVRLDARRRGKLLALEVSARITSADQKCFEIPATEDEGIDMELEFTSDNGQGTGKRLYLQLKSGNSHLKKRKDGKEIFPIKDQRWVEYWIAQREPVMLVIGTFSEQDAQSLGKEKLEFADVRWMEISSVLRRESHSGTKVVKQVEFKGERLDLSSVRRWRDRLLESSGP
jgi:small GTP-binding protein